jgi:hypothetical protein
MNIISIVELNPKFHDASYIIFEDCGDYVLAHHSETVDGPTHGDEWIASTDKIFEYLANLKKEGIAHTWIKKF